MHMLLFSSVSRSSLLCVVYVRIFSLEYVHACVPRHVHEYVANVLPHVHLETSLHTHTHACAPLLVLMYMYLVRHGMCVPNLCSSYASYCFLHSGTMHSNSHPKSANVAFTRLLAPCMLFTATYQLWYLPLCMRSRKPFHQAFSAC